MSKITLLTALPNEWGFRNTCGKKYKDGASVFQHTPKFFSYETVTWKSYRELAEKLSPIIKGEAKDYNYKCILAGEPKEELITSFGYRRLNATTNDVGRDYFIIDLETNEPIFEGISTNVEKIRDWLIETYDWIEKETGMFFYLSPSAGVVSGDKHKQIRIRLIVKHSAVLLTESDRHFYLRNYQSVSKDDFERHIDKSTHQYARMFYLAPPELENTERLVSIDNLIYFQEGMPVDVEKMKTTASNQQASSRGGDKADRLTAPTLLTSPAENHFIMSKTTEEWYEMIGDGARYREIYWMLWSAYLNNSISYWRTKLLNDAFKRGNKTVKDIDSVIQRIEQTKSRSFAPPFSPHGHNLIDVTEYLLKDWEDKIIWKDKGVVFQKLIEGSGKTVGLQELRKLFPEKKFLYLAPMQAPVENASIDLDLTLYQDVPGNELHKQHHLACCYPSLKKLEMENNPGHLYPDATWDIVVLDEIEQLLMFAVNGGGCIPNPSQANTILRKIVERADLVIGLDARISDLSLSCIEAWKPDVSFDIYQHPIDQVLPFRNHTCTITNSIEQTIHTIIEAVGNGNRVGVVTDLDNDRRAKLCLRLLCEFVEERTNTKGIAIDSEDKKQFLPNKILTELSDHKTQKMGCLEELFNKNKLQHIWFSPVNQSAWNYLAIETKVDLVVGIYMNNILTAPNIIQHLKRFRQTRNFYVCLPSSNPLYDYHKHYVTLFPSEFDTTNGIALSNQDSEFNDRHRIDDKYTKLMLANVEQQFINMWVERGGALQNETNLVETKHLKDFLNEKYDRLIQLMKSPELWQETEFDIDEMRPAISSKPTDREVALLLLIEIRKEYDISYSTQLTDELFRHYFKLKLKDDTIINRLIYYADNKERLQDFKTPFNADKDFKLEKGKHLDAFGKLVQLSDYKKDDLYLTPSRTTKLFEDEVIQSEWFALVIAHRQIFKTLFGIKITKDFRKNPLPLLGQFAFKVFGLLAVIQDEQWRDVRENAKAEIIKEHKKFDIYRKLTGKTPRAETEKLEISKEYIRTKANDELTKAELNFKTITNRHLIIQSSQPRWNGYLSKNHKSRVMYLDRKEFKRKINPNGVLAG